MKKSMKRKIAGLLSFLILATGITSVSLVQAKENLVNVALEAEASTDNSVSQWCDGIDAVNDGKDDTNFQSSGEWPTTVVLNLGMNHNISKVVVKVGGADGEEEYRSVDVTVEYAQNGVISDPVAFGGGTSPVNSVKEFNVDKPVSASHIFVTLSNPQDKNTATPGFWAAINEIEVYEETEGDSISNYGNIASQAVITTTGDVHPTDGSANLVDGNDSTLYKFHNAAMTSEKEIVLKYGDARAMDAFRIAFEKVNAPDPNSFSFVYSILARNGSGEYDTIVEKANANRTDNNVQVYQIEEKTYTEVKIVMHFCKAGANNGWPAVAEFEIYGSEVEMNDGESIAYGKPVHASSGKSQAKNITDGSTNSTWRGTYYPAYVDIDLEANYFLDTVEVFTPSTGYSQYTIYTSMDGRDFDKLAEKTSTATASLQTGEVYQAEGKEARIVRVYLEYNSTQSAAVINEVRVTGKPSGTKVQERPEITVVEFDKSEFADTLEITDADTYEEVNGIIERRLGAEYKEWFSLELAENPDGSGYDYFELSAKDGKTHVKGNNGVSLATGINHYLKYFCNVNLSQVGDQAKMPEKMPVLDKAVLKETKAKVRYAYNYCTLSYSMAFYGQKEWREELDWLALNGVNVVLDATAQEEVWRRFLGKVGYEHEDAKDFIAGPAYYAWAYMANLSGFGGPVHDSWFEERTQLARENQYAMRKLGMQPILQGYSGMVPTDIQDYDKDAQIIAQGGWSGFQRPAMLVTTSATFDEYAALFYEAQKEVYGNVSDYYATDPFHEGGNTGGMNPRAIAKEVLTSMLEADKDGIWIIQAWQGNPTTALLNGLDDVANGSQHALILDLYAEKTPHYAETGSSYGDTDEFDDTPWVFCMLNNFGGRLGLHGHLDNLAEDIPYAMNNTEHMAGIGMTPEASVNNPVLYEFLFETIWQDDASKEVEVIDLDSWLADYVERRYGADSESAHEAWLILKDTVYKSDLNNLGQGAPESVVNARPALNINAASTWGNAVISYDKAELERAAALLLEDYDTLKDSEGYMYDVANILQQVLSNSAQVYQKKMAAAYNAKDVGAFEANAAIFLEIIDNMEKVTATSEYFLLGRWVEMAKALGENADDFTKELYELNAKALVTTWGSYNQSEGGRLQDYSNRQWSGLIGDYYKTRWQRWINARTGELKGEQYETNINWFEWEWSWVRDNKVFKTEATEMDLSVIGAQILEKYTAVNEAADAKKDVPTSSMSIYAENYYPGSSATEGNPAYAIDGQPNTFWHTVWSDSARETHYLEITFDDVYEIDGMRFLQRPSGRNGVVKVFDLYVRENEDDEWTLVVDDGVLAADTDWQKVTFDKVNAKQVKFQVVDADSGEVGNKFAAAAEIRFTQYVEEPEPTPTPTPTPDPKPVNPFEDVIEGQYYYDPVLWAVENKVTSGLNATTFGVGSACTREQIVTFLWNYAGQPEAAQTTCAFTDVNPEHYYYKAMLWAVENKITSGLNTTTFGVGQACTREQIVTFLWNYAGQKAAASAACTFKDVDAGHYYYKAMLWAVENGVVAGYNADTFGVGDACTREQIVTFLYRYNNL